ncbi:MAG: hypothetical protein NVSMB55_10040 [Mycobacteriales bacterium]
MLTVLSILGVLAVLFVAAAVATREGPILAEAPGDVADLELPDGPLQPEDLQAVRFGLAVRGYRMAEVDAVLDRLAAELADRDRQLAEVTRGVGSTADPAAVPAIPVVVKSADKPEAEPEQHVAPVVPMEPPLDSPPPPVEEPPVEEPPVEEPPVEEPPVEEPPVEEPPVEEPPVLDAAAENPPPHEDVSAPEPVHESAPHPAPAGIDSVQPEPPPVHVAVVRTEVAPLPPGAVIAAAGPTPEPQAKQPAAAADAGLPVLQPGAGPAGDDHPTARD